MDKKILIVEDELKIARFLEMELQHEGFAVQKEANGLQALDHIVQGDYDLILLDIMLPGMDGITICQKVRELGITVPIIMLTAKDSIEDKVQGLDIGADDYVTKPFNPLELVARVKSQLRRYTRLGAAIPVENAHIYETGGLSINDDLKEVRVDGDVVKLTPIEYNILFLLMKNQGRVFSINQIYENIWNEEAVAADNTVAVHIRHIREKIEINPREPRYLKVVWGLGYKIEKI